MVLIGAMVSSTVTFAAPAQPAPAGDPADARLLFLKGRYDEARKTYEGLARQEPVTAAIGLARCRSAVGDLDGALRILSPVAQAHPGAPEAQAEMARLEFARGNYPSAQAHVDAALALDRDQPAARFFGAELHRVAGRLDQANEGYGWLIRFYNSKQDSLHDPEVFRWIGLAAGQYARWNRNSGQFHFLVNTLYPDALKLDPMYWPAHLEAALLFIEKYNRRDATDELDAAFRINPRAAELHAARALIAFQQFDLDSARASIARALAINPGLAVAHQLSADVEMIARSPREAVAILERARALNPADEETLGRLAALYGAIDGLRDAPGDTRMKAVVAEAVRRNEHCGAFFSALAASLDLLRKYPDAARYYEEARRRMPQLVAAPGQLGLVYMRLGDEARARTLLDEAFEVDPFNVRVKNSLEVLEVLQDYGTIETQHFVLRFDRARDSLLAGYASRYLEEVYPEIVKKLGYQPPGKSLVEIFSRAKGESGHGWFSTRMVGLPFIGTVGACAGKMVAITSPNDGGRTFNWARVLKHEFVHVVNLQQTDFNIPRWYTEALAVRHEGPGRPLVWDQVLARRVAADSLFNLDTINMGFVRPSSGEDWALAYYQAELYARYMAETYGEQAEAKMIAAYADNLDTRSALKRSFGVTQEAFEQGYRRFLGRIAGRAAGPVHRPPAPSEDVPALEQAAARNPRDADLLTRLARAQLGESRPFQAKATALQALEIDPKRQLAAYVVAEVHVLEGNRARALEVLRGAFDPQDPNPEALTLLTNLTLDARDYAEAERLSLLGRQRFPNEVNWDAGLVVVYRQTGQRDKLASLLERRAEGDADDPELRLELARLAVERNDFEGAGRWAREALHIDVKQAEAHALLARALAESRSHPRAIEEYEVAIVLQPETLEWRLALAKACVTAGNKERARQVLTGLLQRDASYAGARELLDTLGR